MTNLRSVAGTTVAVTDKDWILSGRILKVDHAGEHGAVNIYRGQIFVCRWRAPQLVAELSEFQSHEERHRAIFARALGARRLRRCRSYHLCGFGGLMMGLVTALLGKAAIAATTCAVERVVLRHLHQQLCYLRETDTDAFHVVSSIVEDEQAHHDRAASSSKQGTFWPRIVEPVVTGSTESVIWLGMHL